MVVAGCDVGAIAGSGVSGVVSKSLVRGSKINRVFNNIFEMDVLKKNLIWYLKTKS